MFLSVSEGILYRYLCLLFWLEVNMAALGWLRQEAGGGREYWLMLICFASMLWCVSIGSRGPGISAAVLGLPPWLELNPHPASDMMMLGALLTPDPHLTLQHCQASLCVSSWPSQDWELSSVDRRLSPAAREVTAVNAVPGGEDDSHLCHVYGAGAHQGGIMIEL